LPRVDEARLVLLLFALLAAAKLLLVFGVLGTPGPICFQDELIYKENAQLLAAGQPFATGQYPPLYSLLLAPAFLFGSSWYSIMLLINVLITSAIIFPVWLISRHLLPKPWHLAPVALSALLPFQAVFPRMLMSENLFLPLFLFAFYFALVRPRGARFSGLMLGTACALAYLTRFLFLPAVPILFALWWLGDRKKTGAADAGIAIGSFAAMLIPWLAYAGLSGIGIIYALGVDVFPAAGQNAAKRTGEMLATLMSAYASYLALAAAPFILFILLCAWMAFKGKVKISGTEQLFFGAVACLSVAYCSVSVLYSWNAPYNYPAPQYLLGRYAMQLTPLFIIAGMAALCKLWEARRSISAPALCGSTFIALALAYGAHGILCEGRLFHLKNYFANSVFNSVDAASYNTPPLFMALLGVIALAALLLYFSRIAKPAQGRYALLSIFALLLLLQASFSAVSAAKVALHEQWPEHGRALAPIFNADVAGGARAIYLVLDVGGLDRNNLEYSLQFWGVPKGAVVVAQAPGDAALASSASKRYVLTGKKFRNPLLSYYVRGREFYLYDYDAISGTY